MRGIPSRGRRRRRDESRERCTVAGVHADSGGTVSSRLEGETRIPRKCTLHAFTTPSFYRLVIQQYIKYTRHVIVRFAVPTPIDYRERLRIVLAAKLVTSYDWFYK